LTAARAALKAGDAGPAGMEAGTWSQRKIQDSVQDSIQDRISEFMRLSFFPEWEKSGTQIRRL
jgi:hypothetical protein